MPCHLCYTEMTHKCFNLFSLFPSCYTHSVTALLPINKFKQFRKQLCKKIRIRSMGNKFQIISTRNVPSKVPFQMLII